MPYWFISVLLLKLTHARMNFPHGAYRTVRYQEIFSFNNLFFPISILVRFSLVLYGYWNPSNVFPLMLFESSMLHYRTILYSRTIPSVYFYLLFYSGVHVLFLSLCFQFESGEWNKKFFTLFITHWTKHKPNSFFLNKNKIWRWELHW